MMKNNSRWGQRADLAALTRESDSKPPFAAYVILSARYKLPTQSPWGRYAAAVATCAGDVSIIFKKYVATCAYVRDVR